MPSSEKENPTAIAPTWRLATFYFFYFAALGGLLPYWGPYLEHLGFNAAQIGELMAIFMVTRLLAPLLAGWLADRTGKRIEWVRMASLLTLVTFAGVLWGSSYGWLALVMAAFSFCWAAALPPFEAVTLNHLRSQTVRYGRIRLWGSWGFIAAVVALGFLLEHLGLPWLPLLCLIIYGGLALASFLVPAPATSPPPTERPAFLGVLLQPRVLALLATSLLIQASHGPYYTFFSIYLQRHDYNKAQIGPLWALGVIAEIAIFFWTPRLLRRFRPATLLYASLLLAALRWSLLALFVEVLPLLLFAQTLHAASYAVFHAVSIQLIHRFFTGALQTRGQSLYASLSYGLGGALGSLLGGYAWSSWGPVTTYLGAALLPLAGFVLALLWLRHDKAQLE